jgi:hypothetical protein
MKKVADIIHHAEEERVKDIVRDMLRGIGDMGENVSEEEVEKITKKLFKKWEKEK